MHYDFYWLPVFSINFDDAIFLKTEIKYTGGILTSFNCSASAHYTDEIGLAILKHYTRKESGTVDQLFQDICRKAIPACPKGLKPMSVTRQVRQLIILFPSIVSSTVTLIFACFGVCLYHKHTRT